MEQFDFIQKNFGFGMMRLPTVDGRHANGWAPGASSAGIDQELVNRQIDYALEIGRAHV